MALRGKILAIIFLTLLFKGVMAQNNSPLGRFFVDFIKGCSPLTIQVTDNSGSGVSVYQYEGSASATTNQLSYTYSTPGQYYLVQTIQNLSPRQDSLLIRVMDPIPPEFEVFTCENSGASVSITDNIYDMYEIDYGDNSIVTVASSTPVSDHFYASPGTYTISIKGIYTNAANNCANTSKNFSTISSISPAFISSLEMQENGDLILNYSLGQNIFYDIQIAVNNANIFQKLKSISNQSVKDTIRNLNLSKNYCFRIISYDPCVNNTITSNIVCSLDFNATALDGLNELTWKTVPSVVSGFSLSRDVAIIAAPQPAAVYYQDTAVTCNQDYCYTLTATFSGGGQSISNTQCITSFSTQQPDPVTDISITVDNKSVNATWPLPSNFLANNYFLEGNFNNSGFGLVNSFASNFVSGLDSAGCFRVYYTDVCGNTSPASRVGCQLLISFTETQNTLEIFWNDYTGWESGVMNYRLEVYDQNMNPISNNNTGAKTDFTLDVSSINEQILSFRVVAVPVASTLAEISSDFIIYIREPIISLPLAFTPNADGLNDTYRVYGKFINSIIFFVFDRWGNLIFSEKELGNGWDGTINGKPAPDGAYVYNVEIVDFAGRTFKRTGSFVLLR